MSEQFSGERDVRAVTETAVVVTAQHFGGPVGAIAADLAFDYLWPPVTPDPPNPLKDVTLTNAQKDIVIPIIYGVERVKGNHIWKGELTSEAITESTTGGSSGGGSEVTVGYKYFYTGAIGLCEGEIFPSRLWLNGQMFFWRSMGSYTADIVIYKGTSDQTTDPTVNANLDNAVPWRYVAYMVQDEHKIGRDRNDLEQVELEGHRFPYHSSGGDMARVYTALGDKSMGNTETGGVLGISAKDSYGNVWMVVEEEGDDYGKWVSLKYYNYDLSTKDFEIDLSGWNSTYPMYEILDIEIVERGKKRCLYIMYVSRDTDTDYPELIRCIRIKDLSVVESTGNPEHSIAWKVSLRKSYDIWDANEWDDNSTKVRGGMCFNSDSLYLYFGNSLNSVGDNGLLVREYDFEFDSYTQYDISADMGWASGICVNDDYAIGISDTTNDSICVYNLSFSKQSTFDISDSKYDLMCRTYPVWLWGGDEFICGSGDKDGTGQVYFFVFGLDGTTVSLRGQLSVGTSDLWADDGFPTISYTADSDGPYSPVLSWSATGDLVASYHNEGDYGRDYLGVCITSMFCNPAQVIADIADKGNVDNVNESELTTLHDYCLDNQLGFSGKVEHGRKPLAEIKEIMTNLQGISYRDNDNSIGFKIFQDDDSSVMTITESDIIYKNNNDVVKEGVIDFSFFSRQEIPNRIMIEFEDRVRNNSKQSLIINHYLSQQRDGQIRRKTIRYKWVKDFATAQKLGVRLIKHLQYFQTMIHFYIGDKGLTLNRGDLIELDLNTHNYTREYRVVEIDEEPMDMDLNLGITARLENVNANSLDEWDFAVSKVYEEEIDAPSDVLPVIWEEPAKYNNDEYTICCSAVRTTDSTIGCHIYVSEDDGASYDLMGTLNKFGALGDIQTAIDEDDKRIIIDTANRPDTFPTYTLSEQRNDRSFCVAGETQDGDAELLDLEFLSYRESEASGDNLALRHCARGKDYTDGEAHAIDDTIVLVGRTRFLRKVVARADVGKTISIKTVAFNSKGDVQNLDDVSAYEYKIHGYTRKATHVSSLELVAGGEGLGSRTKVSMTDITVQWRKVNRNSGLGAGTFDEAIEHGFVTGDADNYTVIIYQADGTTEQARHENIGNVTTYEYTDAQNSTDFDGTASDHFWIGIVPVNGIGHVEDVAVKKQEVYRV